MQTKQILAIVAVVAMLGAAFVGIGYAYTASVDNANNSAAPTYWKLSITGTSGDQADGNYATFTTGITYNTSTTDGEIYKKEIVSPTVIKTGLNAADIGYATLKVVDQDGYAVAATDKDGYPLAITLEAGKYNTEDYTIIAAQMANTAAEDALQIVGTPAIFVGGTANLLVNTYKADNKTAAIAGTSADAGVSQVQVHIFALLKNDTKDFGAESQNVLTDAKVTFVMSSDVIDLNVSSGMTGEYYVTDGAVQMENKKVYTGSGNTYDPTGLFVAIKITQAAVENAAPAFTQYVIYGVQANGATATIPDQTTTEQKVDVTLEALTATSELPAISEATLTEELIVPGTA